jgi:hypothetical protein
LFLWGKDVFIYKYRAIRGGAMLLSKINKDNVNKAKPPSTFSFCCRTTIGVKSAGGGDCEYTVKKG